MRKSLNIAQVPCGSWVKNESLIITVADSAQTTSI